MRVLLDINVLIALHDRDHVHHVRAATWFEANIQHGWASCPLTQNGCLRSMNQPGYSSPQPLSALMAMLSQSTGATVHETWFDDISVLDAARFQHTHMHSQRQLTDLDLLGLAVKNKGRMASFDQRIPMSAVRGATAAHMVVL